MCVCVCVTDVGVAVTNLRVVCKSITCVSTFTDSKSCWSVAGYAKDAIVGACHRTIDGQEHKIIWRAGKNTRLVGVLDQNKTQFFTYLRVTACREQGKAATVATSD